MSDPLKYWAFISYSHQDRDWAQWLHKAIETYRVPRRLVGRPSRNGPVPARLFPVFRDREELPGSADLGKTIDEALNQSRHLVVICSPRAAISRWVEQEIRRFKAMGREDRVLCLIVDGEPNASDMPDSGLLECFPRAIRYRVESDQQLSPQRAEPIAADLRPHADGKTNAKLKLLAGLLDVNFDELKQRERRRRFWRNVQIAAATLAVLLAVSLVWYQGYRKTQETTRARHLQLADMLLAQAKDATLVRQHAVATVYGAHAVRYRLLAHEHPQETDFLSSLSPPALLTGVLPEAQFSGGIAFHPAGALFASGGKDGAVRLWEAAGGRLHQTLTGHEGPVACLAFSPDGKLLASGGADGTLRIWELPSGRLKATLHGHKEMVMAVAFAPDSTQLASAGRDKTIRIWQPSGGLALTTLTGHSADVNAVAFHPEGRLIASGSKDNSLRLWDLTTGTQQAILATYRQPITSVAFSADGRFLAAGDHDGSAKLWDLPQQREVAALGAHRLAVADVAFSPDGAVLAAASRDRSIKLWEVSTRQELATLTGHPDEIGALAFHPNGRRLVSGGSEGSLRLWRLAPREEMAILAGHQDAVRAVVFSPDGKLLASAGDDTTILLWDAARRTIVHSFTGHRDSVRALVISPDGTLLASAGRDNTIRLWDMAGRRPLAQISAHDDYVVGLAFHPDGRHLASAGWDNKIKIWSVPALTLEAVLEGHTGQVSGVEWRRDGRILASVAYDGTVRLWDGTTGTPLATLTGHDKHVRTLSFAPDGRTLATGGWDRLIRLWDLDTHQETGTLLAHHSYEVWQIVYSPDGRLIACGTPSQDRRTLRLFDVGKRRLVTWLSGHDQYTLAVAFDPKGEILASGGTDAMVRLWRVADFWPRPPVQADDDPGELLRGYLESASHDLAKLDQVIGKIEQLTGFTLVGTVAMPIGQTR